MFVRLSVLVLVATVTVQVSAVDKARLRFKVSARGLPDKDTLGTIDPYVIITYTEFGGASEVEIGRSDTITDNENPDWGNVFEFDFDRSKSQKWNFKIWDHDNGREDDKGGRTWIDVADYVDKGELVNANLDKSGYLTVRAANPEQGLRTGSANPGQLPLPPGTPDTLQLKFKLSANGLSSKDDVGFIQGSSDPYVEIFAAEGLTGKRRKVATSGTLKNTKNPSWGETFEFGFDRRKDQRLQFKIWDNDNLREDDKAGLAWIELNDYVAHGQVLTVNLNKKGTLTITRADGLPPNPYNPNALNNNNPTVPQTQPGFVQPQQQPQTPTQIRGTVPVVTPIQNPTGFNQPQVVQPVAPAPVVPSTAQTQLLRFKLSARNLEDRDIIGTSDPYVKVYLISDGRGEELLKTSSKLNDNENPEWPDIFDFNYDPSKSPRLRFLILDEDDSRRDDVLGDVTVDVSELAQRNYVSAKLAKKGTLSVTRV